MDFGFVGCLAFSNYFKLPHVIRLSFARTAFFYMFFDGTFTCVYKFTCSRDVNVTYIGTSARHLSIRAGST